MWHHNQKTYLASPSETESANGGTLTTCLHKLSLVWKSFLLWPKTNKFLLELHLESGKALELNTVGD